MPNVLDRLRGFLAEMKRRKVYQVSAVYAVVAVGGLELLSVVVPATTLPTWADSFFIGVAIAALPLVLVLAWVFDIAPDGVQKTGDIAVEPSGTPTGATVDAPPPSPFPSASAEEDDATLDPNVVAVLPFGNLSGAPDADPFAAGLHDDLLTELSRVSALTVISRTSVQGYRDTTKSIRVIAREIGAGTIVEGGIQKAGNRVRLNVQLIDARTDVHRWAERYDRELTTENIFDLQSELAASIMVALHARLTSEERARVHTRPTDDLEAYRLAAIGRTVAVDRSERSLREAAGHFERAIERDPSFAGAWADLGLALVALMDYRHSDARGLVSRAETACLRAVELDPELAEAHAAVGCLRSFHRDGPGALHAHARAIGLRPGYAGAHQWRSWVSLLVGSPHDAVDAGHHGTRLDPLDPEARGNLALALLAVGDAELALAEARRATERHPRFDYARWVEGLSLYVLGRSVEASTVMRSLKERWARFWPETTVALDELTTGDVEAARAYVARLERSEAWYHVGLMHGALGDADAAIEAIGRAHPLTWDETLHIRYFDQPPIHAVRRHPGFAEVLREVDRSWGVAHR